MPTSEAQKAAMRRYYEKTKENQKRITISLTAEEYAYSRATMEEHGATPLKVWRAGIAAIRQAEREAHAAQSTAPAPQPAEHPADSPKE